MREDVEKLRRDIDATPKILSYFGLIISLFASFGGGLWHQPVVTAAGIVLAPAALLAPRALRLPYLAAAAGSLVIGQLISRLAMALIFLCVITPLGAVRRLCGQDPLGLGFRKRAQTSYWHDCEEASSERPERMY